MRLKVGSLKLMAFTLQRSLSKIRSLLQKTDLIDEELDFDADDAIDLSDLAGFQNTFHIP